MHYTIEKLKIELSNNLKNMQIRHMFREIRPREVQRLKVENSRKCPGATPTTQGGGPEKACRSICMEGGVSQSGSTVVKPLPGVSGQTANPNCEQ